VIHVVERATTDLVVDTGPTGDSSGDLLTFANDLYDGRTSKVGRDQGSCIGSTPRRARGSAPGSTS
jgi:hypothetical protein